MEWVWYEWVTELVCSKRMKMTVWAHGGEVSTGDGQTDGQANG